MRSNRERGFSLVELITVMSIMAILFTLASLQFNAMQKKSGIEKDVSTIYTNLASVRLQALYTKTPRSVTFSGYGFKIYSSSVTGVTPASTVNLSYPVVGSLTVNFDASGMLAAEQAICIDPSGTLADNPGRVDSVDLAAARSYMGKRQSGGACVPASIDPK